MPSLSSQPPRNGVLIAPILILTLILALAASAQGAATTTSTSPTASSPPTSTGASIFPGTSTWTYYGCYNETTLLNGTNGLRALNGGVMETLDTLTVQTCLTYCAGNSYAFAGLEYTR